MASTRGFLLAQLDGEEYTFDGTTWSGQGRYVQFLNDIREEWDLYDYNLEEKAWRAFNLLIPPKKWEILKVEPDPTDPMIDKLPPGTVS